MSRIPTRFIPSPLLRVVAQVMADQRGAVTMIYGAMLLTMLLSLGIGLDFTNTLQVKAQLDQAADSAAVACGENWQATMTAGAALATTQSAFDNMQNNANAQAAAVARSTFAAQAAQLGSLVSAGFPTVTTVDLTGTTGTNGNSSSATGAALTCTVAYQAHNPTYLMTLAHIDFLPMADSAVSNVQLTPYVEVYFILDTSASMMVGSTPADQSLIAKWVNNNPTKVFGTGANESPCAFACHEEPNGTQFQVSDMLAGEVNAHAAGATTRFDIMRLALVNDPTAAYCTNNPPNPTTPAPVVVGCDASLGSAACNPQALDGDGLLAHIRDCYDITGTRANLGTFTYAMYGFNSGINGNEPPSAIFNPDQTDQSQYVVPQTNSLATVAAGVNKLTIGLNTHLMPPVKFGSSKTSNSVLQDLQAIIGTTAPNAIPGLAANNPLKYVIIITDGMSSDRNWNWCNPNQTPTQLEACNSDPWPNANPSYPVTAAATAPVTVNTPQTTICSNWSGAAPMFDGMAIWQGTTGECGDAQYRPAFWTPLITTGQLYSSPSGNDVYQYASAIDPSYCNTMKANGGNPGYALPGGGTLSGVTIAVLETPYVPMTGQQPPVYPYETGVQQIIYPAGDPVTHTSATAYTPGPHGETMSALSQALLQCASGSNYYYQAASDTGITTGFITLFDNFVGQFVHLSQ